MKEANQQSPTIDAATAEAKGSCDKAHGSATLSDEANQALCWLMGEQANRMTWGEASAAILEGFGPSVYEELKAFFFSPNDPSSATCSAKITQRQLESILINGGIIQAAAIEDPYGYDGGKTELGVTIVTQKINELLSRC